ncbi:hypothetical protein M0813_18076 [Anaeramoeba flamelloides]|uniref:BTB domain-containing protein n=1 Tax=Anaeramoeba flamelloides TaxID=1746091 RepID=A0ABQ8YTP8_9EUKA|nr:hypothetical protein M0813_18076 [Anaeramoeba flamelloides]
MEQKVWFFGLNTSNFNGVQSSSNTPQLTTIKDNIVSMNGCSENLIYSTMDGSFHSTGENTFEGMLCEENNEKLNDRIVKFTSGYNHNLMLTKSGRVFYQGRIFHSPTANNDPESDESTETQEEVYTFLKPKEYTKIKEMGAKCIDVLGGEFYSAFLLENGELYALGQNTDKEIEPNPETTKNSQITESSDFLQLTLISENVRMLPEGGAPRHLIYLTNDYTLWGNGDNFEGQLGIGYEIIYAPQKIEIPDCDNRKIEKMCIGFEQSLILYEGNKLYFAGSVQSGFFEKRKYTFQRLAFFNDKPIKEICCGSYHSLLLTKKNKLYFFGGIEGLTFNNSKEPLLLKLDNYDPIQNLSIGSGVKFCVIFTVQHPCLNQDFLTFYKSQQFTNYQIKGFKVHKSFLEFRLNTKIDKIEQILSSYSNYEIDNFLMWVYSDKFLLDKKLLLQICQKFNIENPKKKSLNNDLMLLYKDEDSKDFSILVSDFEDDQNVDVDVNDEANYDEIPVHKFVLLARSGLFRDLFQNLNEKEKNICKINDYSQKSIDSLEIFIKYLYTEKLFLTADHDPELIFEELSDAAEYYQLSNQSIFLKHLKLIKK